MEDHQRRGLHLEWIVVGLLLDRPGAHGYDLARAYRERLGRSASTGGFYREIARLVRRGLVERIASVPSSDPRRICYRTTARGRTAFHTWLTGTECPDGTPVVKAMFVARLSYAERTRLFEAWRARLDARAAELQAALGAATSASRVRDGAFDVLPGMLERELAVVRADVAFVRRLRRHVAAWARSARSRRLSAADSGAVGAFTVPPAVIAHRELRAG